jgi:hypothetical protein
MIRGDLIHFPILLGGCLRPAPQGVPATAEAAVVDLARLRGESGCGREAVAGTSSVLRWAFRQERPDCAGSGGVLTRVCWAGIVVRMAVGWSGPLLGRFAPAVLELYVYF